MTPADLYARFEPVRDALDELAGHQAVRRLFERDATLFSDDPDVQRAVSDRLGWLDAAGGQPSWSREVTSLAGDVGDDIDRVVVAGMGGSSLAPEVFGALFADQSPRELVVLDSTHPDAVVEALPEDLSSTLVVVASKSGTTTETRAFALRAERLVPSTRHLLAITDHGTELQREAEARGWRAAVTNPADIGGRYSALSMFGMVPAALVGVDVGDQWARGQRMLDACRPEHRGVENPGLLLAAVMGGLARAGRDKLTILTSVALRPLADWIEQLVAESTGKHGRGIVPVVGEPAGPPEVYGDDRAFVVIETQRDPVTEAAALDDAGFPVLRLQLDDRHALAGEFVRWEVATALSGVLLGVDPFDQPNVAESKANTAEVLDDVTGGASLPEPGRTDMLEFLEQIHPGDYVGIHSYLAPDPALDGGITELRVLLRDSLRVATTAGWGPRFLHSTGQLHKGGPDTLVALQLVDVPERSVEIPGRDYDFATLVRAQAIGDLRSLRAHDRRVAEHRLDGPTDLARLLGDVRVALHRPATADRGAVD